jgi:hypothetical protein
MAEVYAVPRGPAPLPAGPYPVRHQNVGTVAAADLDVQPHRLRAFAGASLAKQNRGGQSGASQLAGTPERLELPGKLRLLELDCLTCLGDTGRTKKNAPAGSSVHLYLRICLHNLRVSLRIHLRKPGGQGRNFALQNEPLLRPSHDGVHQKLHLRWGMYFLPHLLTLVTTNCDYRLVTRMPCVQTAVMKNLRFTLTALALTGASIFAQPLQAQQAWTPAASDYPAVKVPAGLKSEPIINSPSKATFRTRLREGSQQGSNFGGHYALLQWGCGEGCSTFFIVDELNGKVYDPGYTLTAPKGGGEMNFGFEYRPDSRLLVMQGCRSNMAETCGKYYMLWTGTKLQTLYRETPSTTIAAVGGMQ